MVTLYCFSVLYCTQKTLTGYALQLDYFYSGWTLSEFQKQVSSVACFFFQRQGSRNIKKSPAHLNKNTDFILGEPLINEFAMCRIE
jgi:hypothetical protein